MMLAAVAGAAPAAHRSAVAHAKSATRDTSRVLVRVAGEAITAAMVQARMDDMPEQYKLQFSGPSGRQQLLDRIVEEKIWLAVANRHHVADRPKVQQQLEQQRRDILIRTWISEQMAANSAPSDSEAKLYYEAHLADYKSPATATVRHIQFATEAGARKLLPMARDPKQDFGKLAEQYSADSLSRKNGGQIGSITHDGMFPTLGSQPALAESVFALGEGKVGGPWKTDRGWHLVHVDQIKAENTRAFEQVRALILRQLGSQRTQDFYRKLLDQARHDIGVTADSAAIKGFVSMKKSARDLFKEAQESTGAPARLAAYEKVLSDWPESDVAPQSQFMIGFIQSEELKNYDEAEKSFRALLQKYPKSELVTSAKWMIDHMRTEEAPAFMTEGADSGAGSHSAAPKAPSGHRQPGSTGKP